VWFKITTPAERKALKPGLVFQEVVSYLKGSAEAVSSDAGWLSLRAVPGGECPHLQSASHLAFLDHNLAAISQTKIAPQLEGPAATCTWALDSFKQVPVAVYSQSVQ